MNFEPRHLDMLKTLRKELLYLQGGESGENPVDDPEEILTWLATEEGIMEALDAAIKTCGEV